MKKLITFFTCAALGAVIFFACKPTNNPVDEKIKDQNAIHSYFKDLPDSYKEMFDIYLSANPNFNDTIKDGRTSAADWLAVMGQDPNNPTDPAGQKVANWDDMLKKYADKYNVK